MKITTLINILLIASLFILTPFTASSEIIDLFPDTPKSVVIEIHQPDMTIKSNIAGTVRLNVSYFDTTNNSTETILENFELTVQSNKKTISFDEPGYYLIELESDGIGEIEISGEGVYTLNLVIIGFFLIIRIAIWVKFEYF
ncbi:MAG: hypothetical protein HeimC2_08480 [Candidatus Heimdallarchaeota archaeon LC_2]|nr:MAG: hypothetical protein HeimC2_08480 [Candidatus Heimdallarchaeota archaeon LC_2]